MKTRLWIITLSLFIVGAVHLSPAQQIKWLRVSELQSFLNEIGAEYECEGSDCTDDMDWPAQYGVGSGLGQHNCRARGLWIGCKPFSDPVEGKTKTVKVIGTGPRDFDDRTNEIFPVEFKLIGKSYHPNVIVDAQNASDLNDFDKPDVIDASMAADREILVRFNTSIGVSVTKRAMVFANSSHGNYFINDYVFKNTGIYNKAGDVKQQTLDSVWFYFVYRIANVGVTRSTRIQNAWGAFSSEWGASTVNHDFGDYRPEPGYTTLRGFYAFYGPNKESPRPAYVEDWGCPNLNVDGLVGSASHAGCTTLHADTSPQNSTDDPAQPKTTWFIKSDGDIMSAGVSQYDETFMSMRYAAMSEGHPKSPHDVTIGDTYNQDYSDAKRQAGGGTSQGQGYGPYRLAYGDSIHIVFAEAVSGLSWEKGREIGSNWLQWRNATGTPALVMPDGSTTSDYNLYKRRWCETGKDSILKTFQRAVANYKANYGIKSAPPPPSSFTVSSGGDRIRLVWSPSAGESDATFNGYVVYRSRGLVLDYQTVYEKIFECSKSGLAHSFDDVTAKRGFDYYYYVQAKDDGTQNTVDPGRPLYSSLFWTVTNVPANLQRPAVTSTLDSIRVVPNPYDIRARVFQFGTQSQYDRLAFYGLPPTCKLSIYTESGELIWHKDHMTSTGDEYWDSTTSSGQIIVSGIYILYVEAPDGGTVIRKFVVIR